MDKSTFTSSRQRNAYQIQVGVITEIDLQESTITLTTEDGSFKTRVFSTDSMEVGNIVDFRQYMKSQTCSVLELKGLTPESLIPAWTKNIHIH